MKLLRESTKATILLTPAPERPVALAADFIGLGYEMSSLATRGLLSAENSVYVSLVKQLGGHGVIRLGGIVADYTSYDADGSLASEPKHTVITHASLLQFAGFLRRTGWTAIWSLNFAQGTLEQAVLEAKAVATALGDRLQAFEVGNEVENYGNGLHPFRTPPYTYQVYRAEYDRWRNAILQAVPGGRFAAPDTASSIEWVERMAADAHGGVQLLTTHYYRNGQQRGTPEQLQQPDPVLEEHLHRLQRITQATGIPWRMCETNSFYGGGRPGLSDTFMGALWTLDFMLLLARNGCGGVNIETGVNQLGFISSYSPVQDDGKGTQSAGVPYYGMLAFAEAARGCSHVHAVTLPENAAGVTAYALGSDTTIRSIVLVNRSTNVYEVSLKALEVRRVQEMQLMAPSMDSKTGVTFGGATVGSNGHWEAAKSASYTGGFVELQAACAVVLLAV